MGSECFRVYEIKKHKGHCKNFTFIKLPWNHSCHYQWALILKCAKQCSFCGYQLWDLASWQVLTVTTKRQHDERIVFWQVSYKNAQPYVFKMKMSKGRKRIGCLYQKGNKINQECNKDIWVSHSWIRRRFHWIWVRLQVSAIFALSSYTNPSHLWN